MIVFDVVIATMVSIAIELAGLLVLIALILLLAGFGNLMDRLWPH